MEENLHPIAVAVREFFVSQGGKGLSRLPGASRVRHVNGAMFLSEIEASLLRLRAPEVFPAGKDVLEVAHALKRGGKDELAAQIGATVQKVFEKATVAKTLAAEAAGKKLAQFRGDPKQDSITMDVPKMPTAAEREAPPQKSRIVEQRWDAMSDARKERLAKLAQALSEKAALP